jgi:branched-chain amino acid transport system permease protein
MDLPLINYIIFCSMYILLSWGIYLPYRCGQIYLAPVYCMAIGGYSAAYAATAWNLPPLLCLVISPLAGALAALLPGLGLKRAPGFTTAIASLALIFILQTVIMNIKALGGQAGLFGIPLLEGLPIISVGAVVVSGLLIHRFDHSRLGRAAETLFYNPEVGAAFGVNLDRMGLGLQIASGALSGLAGAIYSFCVGAIFPAAFGFAILLNVFAMVFIGGAMTMWGAVFFAPILWGIPLILPEAVAEWKDVIYGVLLVGILIFRPEGVISKSMVSRVETLLSRRVPPPAARQEKQPIAEFSCNHKEER